MESITRRQMLKGSAIATLALWTGFPSFSASKAEARPPKNTWECARALSEIIVSGFDGRARKERRDILGPERPEKHWHEILGHTKYFDWSVCKVSSHYRIDAASGIGFYRFCFLPINMRDFDLPLTETPEGKLEGGAGFMSFSPGRDYKLSARELVYTAKPFIEDQPVLDLVFNPVRGSDSGRLVEVHANLNCLRDAYETAEDLSTRTVYKRAEGWKSAKEKLHPLLPRSLDGIKSLFGVPIEHKIDYEGVASRILMSSGIEEASRYLIEA